MLAPLFAVLLCPLFMLQPTSAPPPCSQPARNTTFQQHFPLVGVIPACADEVGSQDRFLTCLHRGSQITHFPVAETAPADLMMCAASMVSHRFKNAAIGILAETSRSDIWHRAEAGTFSERLVRSPKIVGSAGLLGTAALCALLIMLSTAGNNKRSLVLSTTILVLMCAGQRCRGYIEFNRAYAIGAAYSVAAIPNGGGYYLARTYEDSTQSCVSHLDTAVSFVKEYLRETEYSTTWMSVKYTSDGGCVFVGNAGTPYVIKLDSTLKQEHSMNITGAGTCAYSIVPLSNKGYAVVGADPGFVLMLDSNLATVWCHNFSSSIIVYDVIELPNRNQIAVVGSNTTGYYGAAGSYVVYDFSGSLATIKTTQSLGSTVFRGLTYLSSGAVGVIGTIGDQSETQMAAFAKLSLTGELFFCKTLYDVYPAIGMAIKSISEDRIVLVGHMLLTTSTPHYRVWVRVADLEGAMQWQWMLIPDVCSGLAYGVDTTDDGAVAVTWKCYPYVNSQRLPYGCRAYLTVKGYCGPGTFYNNASSSCANCSAGYYQRGYARISCTPCETGTYQDEIGQNSCKTCPTNCAVCSAIEGGQSCWDKCEDGYYITSDLQCRVCDFRCSKCTDGGYESCSQCDFTIEGVLKTGTTTCDCAEGYVADTTLRACVSIVLMFTLRYRLRGPTVSVV